MKLRAILKEVTDRQSREMITGIADILRDVKDKANRVAIAKRMIKKFEREGVKYDAKEFFKLVGIGKESLQEIGETTAKPYSLTKVDESVYYVIYEFEAKKEDEEDKEGNKKDDKEGIKYRIIIGKNFRGEDPDSDEERDENQLQFIVSFGVVKGGVADFEAEFKDVKNLFRVMATVIKAINIAIEDEEDESGIPVTRIKMEPTKKDKSDTRRANLYMRFIEENMPPGSKISTEEGGSVIVVDLPTE